MLAPAMQLARREAMKRRLTTEGYPAEEKQAIHKLIWAWILSDTEQIADTNREKLLEKLRPKDKEYVLERYERQKHQFIKAYIRKYANLGCSSTQRGESIHPRVKSVTNRHTPIG